MAEDKVDLEGLLSQAKALEGEYDWQRLAAFEFGEQGSGS